jgi:UDP-N-acetylmuramoyl-L-alanyl-D-glutamate--2,6-diaminopimelate ligase
MSQAPTLIHHASVESALAWLLARGVRGLATDSRRVRPGDAFIAWPGYGVDARQFVPQALAAGALACLVEADGSTAFELDPQTVSALPDLKAATGELASGFFGEPSTRLRIVASTGTNGKTSTAWWTAQALSLLGARCGVVGTLGIGEPPTSAVPDAQVVSTGLTTPDPVTLQFAFRQFADEGFQACAIEASSIGVVEQRLAGTHVEIALFTNFTRDHLDYHGTMDAYWAAKRQLFAWPGLRAAVLNVDDEQGASLVGELAGGGLDLWTYSARDVARLRAQDIHYADGGLTFTLREGDEAVDVHSRLIGDYNVSNLLAVIGGLRAMGHALADIVAVVPELSAVPGRMERVDAEPTQPVVVVDYAHTPDALEKALYALRPFARERGGLLWVVFGCGGNRDATKRPLMGGIAERLADRIVVTSDNPRNEAPEQILREIVEGMASSLNATVLEDRRAAIAHALHHAGGRDVVLIAGKGHEAEQEIAGVKHPFSDVLEAQAMLAVLDPEPAPSAPVPLDDGSAP